MSMRLQFDTHAKKQSKPSRLYEFPSGPLERRPFDEDQLREQAGAALSQDDV